MNILNGWKSYIAAAVAALLAANGVLHFLPPNVVEIIGWLTASLGIAGIRHAITKSNLSLALYMNALYPTDAKKSK